MKFLKRVVNFLIALLLLYLLYLAIIGEGVIDLRWLIPYVDTFKTWISGVFGKRG